MRDKTEFYNILEQLDGEDFAGYSQLVGDFDFSRFVLKINHVQAAAEEEPTLLMVRVPQMVAGFPPVLLSSPLRRTALEDFLIRRVIHAIDDLARYNSEGVSRRRLFMASPGQKIVPRTALLVTEEFVEARIYASLPGDPEKVVSDAAREIFFEDLMEVVNQALIYCNLNEADLVPFVTTMENADYVRQLLPTQGYVGFVGEGASPERLDGGELPAPKAQGTLQIADGLKEKLELPNGTSLQGLGVPQGLTLILGDDYSGRSALMQSLADGIYNHVPHDGREYIISVPDAVEIPSEPGRPVQRVDISPFVTSLPGGRDPSRFSSASASAFEAQAASTVEALDVGARVLLFDEARSSSSFLGHDPRLGALLPGAQTITVPLLLRARQIVEELGVSIIIAGSSAVAEYIPIADTVLRLENYTLQDITAEAKAAQVSGADAVASAPSLSNPSRARFAIPSSIDPSLGPADFFIEAVSRDALTFGRNDVDLSEVMQLADACQVETIGRALYYVRNHYLDERRTLRDVLDLLDRDLSTEGLECLTRDLRGDLARPRRYEIAAVLNRLPSLRVQLAAATT